MAAYFTGNDSKFKAQRQFTEKAFLGRLFEDCVAASYRRRGFRILHRNYRQHRTEIDLIAKKGGVLFVIEVRGRTSDEFLPVAVFAAAKRRRILRFSAGLARSRREYVLPKLVQVVGDPRRVPRPRWLFAYLAPLSWWGLEIREFDLD